MKYLLLCLAGLLIGCDKPEKFDWRAYPFEKTYRVAELDGEFFVEHLDSIDSFICDQEIWERLTRFDTYQVHAERFPASSLMVDDSPKNSFTNQQDACRELKKILDRHVREKQQNDAYFAEFKARQARKRVVICLDKE